MLFHHISFVRYLVKITVDLIKGSVVLTLSGSVKQDTDDSDKVSDKKPVKPNNDKDDKDDEDDDIKDNDDKNENNNPSIDVPESSLPTE